MLFNYWPVYKQDFGGFQSSRSPCARSLILAMVLMQPLTLTTPDRETLFNQRFFHPHDSDLAHGLDSGPVREPDPAPHQESDRETLFNQCFFHPPSSSASNFGSVWYLFPFSIPVIGPPCNSENPITKVTRSCKFSLLFVSWLPNWDSWWKYKFPV